jgi:hypothetical protein
MVEELEEVAEMMEEGEKVENVVFKGPVRLVMSSYLVLRDHNRD